MFTNAILFFEHVIRFTNLLPSSPSGAGSSTTYPLQHMGAGGNAIAAAASQAIAATQQLVPGRRTSSLKASYEAINLVSSNCKRRRISPRKKTPKKVFDL